MREFDYHIKSHKLSSSQNSGTNNTSSSSNTGSQIQPQSSAIPLTTSAPSNNQSTPVDNFQQKFSGSNQTTIHSTISDTELQPTEQHAHKLDLVSNMDEDDTTFSTLRSLCTIEELDKCFSEPKSGQTIASAGDTQQLVTPASLQPLAQTENATNKETRFFPHSCEKPKQTTDSAPTSVPSQGTQTPKAAANETSQSLLQKSSHDTDELPPYKEQMRDEILKQIRERFDKKQFELIAPKKFKCLDPYCPHILDRQFMVRRHIAWHLVKSKSSVRYVLLLMIPKQA